MRRLTSTFERNVTVFAVALISVLCHLAFLPYTAMHVDPQVSCSSACSSHGQIAAIGSQPLKDKKVEKDPAPPTLWPRVDIKLVSLYLSATVITSYAVSIARKEALLTTQMRF